MYLAGFITISVLLLGVPSSGFAVSGTSCEKREEAKVACNSAIAGLIGDDSRVLRMEKREACARYEKLKAGKSCISERAVLRVPADAIENSFNTVNPVPRKVGSSPVITMGFQRPQPATSDSTGVYFWLAFGILFLAFLGRPTVKGYLGELLLRVFTRLTLSKRIYKRLYNVTLPTPDGTTQIDHIFVSPYGIFVVETKNMKGWIFGSANQAEWTQKFRKSSYKFQNPLRQNYKHTKAIENLLDVPPSAIYSVVCFVGHSLFKTDLPPNVTHGLGSVRYIKSFKERVFSDERVRQVVRELESARYSATWATNRLHVENLRAKHGSGGSA